MNIRFAGVHSQFHMHTATASLFERFELTTTYSAFCPGSKPAFVPVRLLSRVAEPGQKMPDVKKKFAHHGIRSQDLLPSAWFPYQLT